MKIKTLFCDEETGRFSLESTLLAIAFSVPFLLILGRAAADIGMGLVSVSFLYGCARYRSFVWIRQSWFLAAAVAFGYLALAGIFADFDKGEAVTSALKDIRFPLFAVAFAHLLNENTRIKKYFVPWMVVLLGFVAIDTIVQFVFGTSLSGHPKPDYQGRLTGPFDRLVVGVYLERLVWPVIGVLFGWAMTSGKSFKKLSLAIAFSLLVGVAVLLSGERMSLMLFGLCGLLFAIGAKNLRLPLFVCGVIVAVAAVSTVTLQPTLKERFITRTMPYLTNLSASPYGSVWHNGLTAWKHSPVLGVGRDNFVPACETLGRPGGFINEHEEYGGELKCVRHPHNIYIEWMAEGGIVGLGLFLTFMALIIRQAFYNLNDKNQSINEYYMRLGLLIGLVPFLWPFMSSMSFFTNWSAVLFWWVMGLVLQPRQKRIDVQ